MCAMRLESCSGFCCGPGAAVEGVVVVPPVVDVVAVVVVVVELVEELVVSVEADAAVVVATVFVVGVDPPIGKDPGFTLHTLYNGEIFKHYNQNFLHLCKFTTTPVFVFKNYTVCMILFYFHPSFRGVTVTKCLVPELTLEKVRAQNFGGCSVPVVSALQHLMPGGWTVKPASLDSAAVQIQVHIIVSQCSNTLTKAAYLNVRICKNVKCVKVQTMIQLTFYNVHV